MDIHCISYTNIWPFHEKPVSVVFHAGSYLIKAPIGTGKSFLFFDGPLFALYKYAARGMLSRQAKQWVIQCIFTCNETMCCIQRTITATKAWNDSTKSRLWTFDQDGAEKVLKALEQKETVLWWEDICHDLLQYGIEFETTNQREIDTTLSVLLPPREVTSAIYLMMQESEHIFELPSSQRINVFKHIFGMLWIDDAKTTLQERRKELQGMLLILDDTNQEQAQFTRLLQEFLSTLTTIKQSDFFAKNTEFKTLWEHIQSLSLVQDSTWLDGTIGIEWFSLDDHAMSNFEACLQGLQQIQQQAYALQSRIDASKKESETFLLQHKQKQRTMHTLRQEQASLEAVLKQIDHTRYQTLTTQKQSLQATIDQLDTQRSPAAFQVYDVSVQHLVEAQALINQRIEQWKTINAEIKLQQQRLDECQRREQTYHQTIDDYKQQQAVLDQQYDQQMQFHCDKIKGACPYVEMIKWAAWRSLKQQRELVAANIHKEQQRYAHDDLPETIHTIQQTLETLHQQRTQIANNLKQVDRKTIESLLVQYQAVEKEVRQVEKALLEYQEEQMRSAENQKRLESIRTEVHLLQQSIDEVAQNHQTSLQQTQTLQETYHQQALAWVDTIYSHISTLKQTYSRLGELLEQFAQKKQQKHTIEQELKRVKALYTIFAKELMVVVLQDFLPQLQEVINANLAQVVSYQVRFEIPASVDETLELDIMIVDELWTRPVKALSWWQRAILKICWILSVARLKQSKFLFLDETITSLDASAVGRVWELLKNFVHQTMIKLYVVTHAQQIQDMDLRTKTIEIDQWSLW